MDRESLELPSFAKINWFLRVFGRREDGYHEICTAFQTISLCDRLRFAPAGNLLVRCSDPLIPTDGRNLILRAAQALKESFGVSEGADIFLQKNIPSPGGLGGGSSNAAAAILGLAALWKLRPEADDLVRIAASVGSDVPFFLFGGTALGEGRGTRVSPLGDVTEKYIALITPDVEIPTPEAYARLAERRLTKNDPKSILKICYEQANRLVSGQNSFENDFADLLFERDPGLQRIRDQLLAGGARAVAVSGSGASIFGIFDNDRQRQFSLRSFDAEPQIRKFAVATVSRAEFVNAYEPCKGLLPNVPN